MTGPVNGILNAYPTLLRCRILWNCIKVLSAEIKQLQANERWGITVFWIIRWNYPYKMLGMFMTQTVNISKFICDQFKYL